MSKKEKKKKQAPVVPQTVTDSIPYLHVFENGIIEISEGKYSKSYRIPAVNFKTASQQDQWALVQKFSDFLGAIDANVGIQISLYNKTVDIATFQEDVLLEMKMDALNEYREEYNEMLLEKMTGAKKILTLTIESPGIDDAVSRFVQLDGLVTENMTMMTKHNAEPLTIIERLEILNTIYNQDSTVPLYRKQTIQGHEVESFTLENCKAQGITTKDVIAPACLSFTSKYINVGNTLANTYYISNYPTWLKGTLLTDFTQLPTNMIVSAYFNVIPQEEAIKLIKRQRVNIGASIIQIQKKSARDGIDASLISPDLTEAQYETNSLMSNITKDNGHLFTVTTVITLFAPDEETMKTYETQLMAVASKNMVTVKPLGLLKEPGSSV